MTIKNYTFLSPTGTEFPVSATADRRLYLMLGGMNYDNFKMKHWQTPTNSGLNRVYTDTSFVVGGAYFELNSETITLSANTTNFVHVNIDLSNLLNPVFLTVEKADNSNGIDINTKNGVLKRCVEIITTSGVSISSVEEKAQSVEFQEVKVEKLVQKIETAVVDLGWGLRVTLTKKNGMVFANGTTTPVSNAGTSPGIDVGVRVPAGFRPIAGTTATLKLQGNNAQWGAYAISSDGNIRLTTGAMNVGYIFYVNGAWVAE